MATDRRPALLAIFLVVIASARIVSTYRVFNHVIDEPDHLAAGMEWLSIGKYRYEDQHPPLARIFGALGPFLAGERFRPGPNSYGEGYRILGRNAHYERILSLGRLGILPFFWIACVVVYRWACRAHGSKAGVWAVLLFTTVPPILAHSGLITTDMAVTAFIGAAALVSLHWADNPDRNLSVLLGFTVGLALLSKFSALVFLPAAWSILYVSRLARSTNHLETAATDLSTHRRAVLVVAATAFLTVWSGYLFSFAAVPFLHLRLPAPRFFSGIHRAWQHNAAGHPSYLLGATSHTGFRYYYPVVLALKTPLGFILLAICAPWVLRRARNRFPAFLPLVFSLAILLAATMSRINIGLRHVLPVYIGVSVSCGIGMAALFESNRGGRAARVTALLLVSWSVVSGALEHPDYLAYTNEPAGRHPERFVADSDLDWGQDMKRLREFLKQRGAGTVAFAPFNRTYLIAGCDFPQLSEAHPDHPSPAWNAVSITLWKVFRTPTWPDHTPEQIRIGRSILVWHFPAQADIRRRSPSPR